MPVAQRLAEEITFFARRSRSGLSLEPLAFWLFNSTREDELARAALEETECRRQSFKVRWWKRDRLRCKPRSNRIFFLIRWPMSSVFTRPRPAQGQEMLASLINYLRAALPSMRQSGSTLSRELELARSFLTILKMRMRERLGFSIDHDPALENARVPPMLADRWSRTRSNTALSPLPQGRQY